MGLGPSRLLLVGSTTSRYALVTGMLRTFAVSAFGSVTASTPFLNDADAFSLCTSTGSSMPRRNAP